MRRSIHAFTVATIASVVTVACGNLSESTPSNPIETAAPVDITSGTVLRNVTVVDTRTGSLTPGRALVIDKGVIQQILTSRSVQVSGGATEIDGSGKFVVPGYLDMHTHAVSSAFGPTPYWPLLLANGVTGVREMAGTPQLLSASSKINSARLDGTLDAPKILQMPGVPVAGALSAADGSAAVKKTQSMKGQFVKVINAGPEALQALLAEAKAQGLDVAGHLSPGLSAVDSVNGGFKAIEHLGGIWSIQLDCAKDQADIRAALLAVKGSAPPPPTYVLSPYLYSAGNAPYVQRIIDNQDAVTCDTVAQALVDKGAWQVPTLIRMRTMLQSDSPAFINDPNLKYVAAPTRVLWNQLAQQYSALQPGSALTTFRAYNASFVSMLKLLRKHGVASKLLTGTDIGGIWIIPGFSLHQEFRELANVGFTPLEVLQATTLNGARFLNQEATMGTVEARKNADLVLLEANPLLDVANLSKIAGVFNAGKYFPKRELDTIKEEFATISAAVPLEDANLLLDSSHTH
jgi:hypothetical protein